MVIGGDYIRTRLWPCLPRNREQGKSTGERKGNRINMLTPGGGMKQKPMTPEDMKLVDQVFTGYIRKGGNDTDARLKTITYLTRVMGWEFSFARRAAAIAIEDSNHQQ